MRVFVCAVLVFFAFMSLSGASVSLTEPADSDVMMMEHSNPLLKLTYGEIRIAKESVPLCDDVQYPCWCTSWIEGYNELQRMEPIWQAQGMSKIEIFRAGQRHEDENCGWSNWENHLGGAQ